MGILRALFLVFTGATMHASCCMCSEPLPSVKESFQRSTVVFVGRVERSWADEFARLVARLRPLQRFIGDRRVRWEVMESIRGTKARHIVVTTGYDGCTFDFQHGETYLVYAVLDPDGGEIYTSSCMRTVSSSRMNEDLAVLRAIRIGSGVYLESQDSTR